MASSPASATILEDLLVEIFLRLPTLAALARAAAACTSFRRLIKGRAFRSLHRPPLLGFMDAGGFHPAEAPHPSAPLAAALAPCAEDFSFVPPVVSSASSYSSAAFCSSTNIPRALAVGVPAPLLWAEKERLRCFVLSVKTDPLLSTIRLCTMIPRNGSWRRSYRCLASMRTTLFLQWVQPRASCSFEALRKALIIGLLIVTHWRSRLMKSPRSVARRSSCSIPNMQSRTIASHRSYRNHLSDQGV